MSARGMLVAMVAGTALTMLVGARRSEPARVPPPEPRLHEEPWLTKEAAAEIIRQGGGLGPLFDGVVVGGPAPGQAVQARIAEFARRNRVAIDLDIVDAQLVAIRFAVTYSGGVGYEGADVLALRLERPSTGHCCVCGDDTWINDWTIGTDDGLFVRARVDVNRVEVKWQRQLTLPALLERADAVLGMDALALAQSASRDWRETSPGRRYELHLPYSPGYYSYAMDWRSARGLELIVAGGKVVEVSLDLYEDSDTRDAWRERWGRPRKTKDEWTWRKADRIVTADLDEARITIRKRGVIIPE